MRSYSLGALFNRMPAGLRRLAGYLAEYRGQIAASVVFMLLAGGASSLIAMLLGRLTDIGFYDEKAWVIVAAPVGLILIAVLHGASMFMSNYLLGNISQSIMARLRAQMFAKLIRWPAASYQRNHSGSITSKFVFEANVALSNASKSSITLVRDSFQVVSLTLVLVWKDWTLALISLFIAPLVAWLLRYIADKMREVMASCQASFVDILKGVRAIYDGHRLVKISNAYDFETRRFAFVNDAVRKMMIDMSKITVLGTPLTQLICMVGVAVVLTFAMYQVSLEALTLGDFVMFLAALLLLMPPLKNLAGVNAGFVIMNMAAQSIFDTLDELEESDAGRTELASCSGDVLFENVCLRYPDAQTDAVHDFTLHARPGDVIALVGLSGAGKSSVVQMLPRFWNPTSGRILIDGVDAASVTLASLRSHIAIVSQNVFLFDGTIRENIAYGASGVTEEALERVLEASALSDFIETLPQGLDTQVGEAGSRLSGGQKQRISIARALLKNAPILILDEATSALDSQSEAVIKEALARLMAGRTTFIVAHRLSTIENATQIVAMQGGIILEKGTRKELLAKKGLFAELTRLQSLEDKKQEAEAA